MAVINRGLPLRVGLVAIVAVLLPFLLAGTSDARPRCHGHTATIIGGAGGKNLHGTSKPDVIVGGGGPDRVFGGRGHDLVCGGPGDDLLVGGTGGDRIDGGSGNDRLFGGQQNDVLIGSAGDDAVIGGIAFNTLLGGPGDDLLRDGVTLDGGPGSDWVSFADQVGAYSSGPNVASAPNGRGAGMENIVGTRFGDHLSAGYSGILGTVRGLGYADPLYSKEMPGGPDVCQGFAVVDCPGPWGSDAQPTVLVDAFPPDPGVTVVGSAGSDNLTISSDGRSLRVAALSTVEAGPGCQADGPAAVECALPGGLGYVLAYGADGDDSITVEDQLGPGTTVRLDGGAGNDVLTGGPGDDDLYAGAESWVPGLFSGPEPPYGPTADTLIGRGGDDALWAGLRGGDQLYGDAGADQLSAFDPCGGALLRGGTGSGDIANFSLASYGIRARLGGTAATHDSRYSAPCTPTRLGRDLELLEGTRGRDLLIGDRGRNPLIVGHEGDDILRGLGGPDHLVGETGFDELYGGKGRDVVDCGRDGGYAQVDPNDRRRRACSG